MNSLHELVQRIETAFHGIELGDGVSLHETVVLDNYGSQAERAAAREPDEKHDWRKLVGDPELLRIGPVGGPCFFDARGMHFHLPAYLCAATDKMQMDVFDAWDPLVFLFEERSGAEVFSLLTDAQRECVRDVLVFLRDECELDLDDIIAVWTS